MKQRILAHITALTVVACFMVLPACRKKHQITRIPPAPQVTPPPSAPQPGAPGQKPLAVPLGYAEEGIASWYGIPFHGRPAADGEIYNMEALVAAHRVMPFNTWLRVTNLANNKTVNVRVIDRGPFVQGRIIDLSKAAARQIDLLGPGIGQVRLEVIAAPLDIPANNYYAVQVGAFTVYANAKGTRDRFAQRFGTAQIAVKQGAVPMWRVLVGKERSIEAAQNLANQLKAEDRNVFVVRLDQTLPTASGQTNPTEPTSAAVAEQTPQLE